MQTITFSVTDVKTISQGPNMSTSTYQSSEPVNTELLLEAINSREVTSLYPLIFFYATILIVGLLGNSLVLLVYTFRYRRSPARVYILFLALTDFSICLFGLPYHLIDLTHPYTYTNSSACKALTFIIVTLFHTSIFGLIVIAIDRYLKICKPLGKVQISYFGRRKACAAAVIAAVLMSWPNIWLYGPSEMESSVANITGHACFFETTYLGTRYPFIYIMSTLCICIGSTTFLIVAYALICHQICTRYKCNKSKLPAKCVFDETTITDEISLKNCSMFTQAARHRNGPGYYTSTGDMHRCDTNISKCTGKEDGFSETGSYDEKFIMYNSNGSLTFVGDSSCLNSNPTELAGNLEQEVQHGLNDTIEPLLLTDNGTTGEGHMFNHKLNGADDMSKTRTRTSVDAPLPDNCIRRNISEPKQHHKSLQSLNKLTNPYNNRMYKYSDASSLHSIQFDNCDCRKSGRLSLQVPNCIDPLNKKLPIRRTSDLTGDRIATNQIHNKWTQYASMAGGRRLGSDDGLRIHTSCHSLALSAQGTFKVKTTVVTKQHTKITKIMLTITIIFILSYTPALVVTIWSIVKPEFWDILDERETIICEFFLRFYLINNICNPFIYGFWDKRFKREIRYTFRKIAASFACKVSCLETS